MAVIDFKIFDLFAEVIYIVLFCHNKNDAC